MRQLVLHRKMPIWLALISFHAAISLEGVSPINTWTGSVSSDLTADDNWDPTLPQQPPNAGDQAIFGGGATSFSPSLSGANTFGLYEAIFSEPTASYTFEIAGESLFTLGLEADSHAELTSGFTNSITIENEQLISVKENASIIFYGQSSASKNDDLNIVYSIGGSSQGSLQFQEDASAGYAEFFVADINNLSTIDFYDTSTAASSLIHIKPRLGLASGTVNFQDTSTAENAQIIVGDVGSTTNSSGSLNFYGSSSAGSSTLQVGDHLGDSYIHFYGESNSSFSTAGNSTILVGIAERQNKTVDGTLIFHGYSSASQANITVSDDVAMSYVYFNDSSTADNSSITLGNVTTNLRGNAAFNDSSTAGSCHIFVTNVSTLTFSSTSSADAATLIVADTAGEGYIHFNDESLAGTSTITLGDVAQNLKGSVVFNDSSSAENASIFVKNASTLTFSSESSADRAMIQVSNGHLYFNDTSSAGSSTITLGNVEDLLQAFAVFNDSSSAASCNILVTNASTLTFTPSSSGGESSIELSTGGTLLLDGASSYAIASLTADASSLITLGTSELTINYNKTPTIEIAGSIEGTTGSLIKRGTGTLIFSGSSTYTGLTSILEGVFINNGSIAGDVLVTDGTLSGVGTIMGSLTVNGGLIAPGNSPGTLTILGDYTQSSHAPYLVQVEANASSLIQVSGAAFLDHSPVNLTLLNDDFNLNEPYLILQAEEGLSGIFIDPSIDYASIHVNPNLLEANISYSYKESFLTLQTTLEKVAVTNNQKIVAKRWDALKSPNTEETTFLNDLIRLNTKEARLALDELSGEPYANWLFIEERTDERFLKSLYEPIRSEMVSSSCERCSNKNLTLWVDGGVGRSFLESEKGVGGLRLDNYETTLGIHGKIGSNWTLGLAGSYEHDRISYKIEGEGSHQTGLGALYSLYRPQHFYLLIDLIGGYGQNKVKRSIDVDNGKWLAHGKAKIYQMGLYTEAGFDVRAPYFLLQPFLGLQGNHYHLYKTKEHGTYPIALTLLKKNRNTASSRLGIHLTGYPESCLGFFGLDIDWHCLLTSPQQHIAGHFQAFGDSFSISGVPLKKNSLEGSIFAQTYLWHCSYLFARASAEKWANASTYDLMIGIKTSW